MNTARNPFRLNVLTLTLLLSTFNPQLSTLHAQGSLTPPGAPAPTMKTLDQIEPRIDVARLAGDAGSHFIISNAGSYYLSANLAVTKTNGITIAAAGVTLDLNGFEIARVSGSGGDGIRINSGSDRTAVRHGTLRGFNYGVDSNLSPFAKGCLFEQLAVTGCAAFGIFAGESARVLDCRAHDDAGSGIYAYNGSAISGCTAEDNQGIYGIAGNLNCTISGCIAQGNQGFYGIYGGAGSTISGCVAYNNTGTVSSSYGIFGVGANMIIGCTSRDNDNTNSPATADQGIGIYAGSTSMVKNCNVNFNKGDGIRVAASCLVEGNACVSNGNSGDGAGIHSTGTRNRIEANTVTSNDRGIDVDSTASLIIRNSASGNTTNYDISANNVFGVIVDRTAPASAAATGSSAASSAATTNSWANFSY